MTNVLLTAPNRILPALVTPLTADGALDVASAERLIEHLYAQGVGGLYVTGSTGEGIYLDPATRQQVVELAVRLSRGHGLVIAHVGAVQAAQAFQLAAHAARAGADAVSSIPPFAGGYSWDEVYGYYTRLCAASPLPVLAYYIPVLTGQALPLDKLAELAELKGIAGFKFTDYNLYLMQRLLARLRGDQIIYNGPDEMLSLGLAMGAHGGIGTTYNFMPRLMVQVAELVGAGQIAEAVEVQKQMNEVIEILLSYHGLAASKQILYWQGLIDTAVCAPPRAALNDANQAELRRRLEKTVIADTLVR
ncbi:MAG: dihydrodipicolinate synthase family protein [Planctomycetia bacterium]|nr:dihydrodipicolinate synthase family protein [Planctomycetia bacterium]